MSILDAEQSARYIDSLVASVQALEADLAATRDTLRQAAGKCADHECRIDRLDAIRLKWESLAGSTPWRLAGLGYERAYTKFNADRKPENDPADVIRWLLNRADLYDSEKQRAGQAEANFEHAQARIAVLEQAISAVLAEPFGCRFCDSGQLRTPDNPSKGHDENCGFVLMQKAMDGVSQQTVERCSQHPGEPMELVCVECFESDRTAAANERAEHAQARIAALEAESDGRRRILLEKAEALRSAEIGLMRAEAEVENLQRLLAQADARGREE